MFKRMKDGKEKELTTRQLKKLKLKHEVILLGRLSYLTKLLSFDNQDIVELASKVKDMDISAIVQEVLKNQDIDTK